MSKQEEYEKGVYEECVRSNDCSVCPYGKPIYEGAKTFTCGAEVTYLGRKLTTQQEKEK